MKKNRLNIFTETTSLTSNSLKASAMCSASCGEVRRKAAKCGELRQSMVKCVKVRRSAAKYGEVQLTTKITISCGRVACSCVSGDHSDLICYAKFTPGSDNVLRHAVIRGEVRRRVANWGQSAAKCNSPQ